MKIAKAFGLMCLALWPLPGAGEERSLGVMMLAKGMTCDQPHDIIVWLRNGGRISVPGCAFLVRPYPAEVILTGIYEQNGYLFVLSRFKFMTPFGPLEKYGYWGTPIKVDVAL